MMNVDFKILAHAGGGDLLGYTIQAADSNINIKVLFLVQIGFITPTTC